jgi:hypothetical protein
MDAATRYPSGVTTGAGGRMLYRCDHTTTQGPFCRGCLDAIERLEEATAAVAYRPSRPPTPPLATAIQHLAHGETHLHRYVSSGNGH